MSTRVSTNALSNTARPSLFSLALTSIAFYTFCRTSQSLGNSTYCNPCAVGSYQDAQKQASCKSCAVGSIPVDVNGFTSMQASIACTQCLAGSSLAIAAAECLPCDVGKATALPGGAYFRHFATVGDYATVGDSACVDFLAMYFSVLSSELVSTM